MCHIFWENELWVESADDVTSLKTSHSEVHTCVCVCVCVCVCACACVRACVRAPWVSISVWLIDWDVSQDKRSRPRSASGREVHTHTHSGMHLDTCTEYRSASRSPGRVYTPGAGCCVGAWLNIQDKDIFMCILLSGLLGIWILYISITYHMWNIILVIWPHVVSTFYKWSVEDIWKDQSNMTFETHVWYAYLYVCIYIIYT